MAKGWEVCKERMIVGWNAQHLDFHIYFTLFTFFLFCWNYKELSKLYSILWKFYLSYSFGI
jgi:hypothetical protein